MSEIIYVEKLKQGADGNWNWVPEPLEINTEEDFTINERELNREICRMGQLLVSYGDLAAELNAELKRKEEYVKYIEARVASALRSSYEAAGTRVTEGKLAEEVKVDTQYQAALNTLHILRASAAKAEHWWRAMNTKAKMLESLAFKQNAEIRRGI